MSATRGHSARTLLAGLVAGLALGAPSAAAGSAASPLLAKELAVLTHKGISPARAAQALDVQAKVARAQLPSLLQGALGGDFGGVWFDAASARLHVGVTSTASRRTAEAIAAQAGLAASVIATPVRSTMAQLLGAQERWNHKLANLFARDAVTTALEPQRNAVAVTLSSAVPAAQRAELEREAAASSVNVVLSVAASAGLGLTLEAGECNNFTEAAENADCEPSLTAGVEIWNRIRCLKVESAAKGKEVEPVEVFFKTQKECEELKVKPGAGKAGEEEWIRGTCKKVAEQKKPLFFKTQAECEKLEKGGEGEWELNLNEPAVCTAGPLAFPVANKNERVDITAGHCIDGGGGNTREWFAFTRKMLTEPLIGKAIEFSNGGAAGAKAGDYGDIGIEAAGGWQTGGATDPVLARTAEWNKAKETRYSVKGERLPVVGNTNCHEGRTSGESCGEISQLNVSQPSKGKVTEGLVADSGNGLTSAGGDSGGPWLFVQPNNEVLMEGSHVGKGNVVCVKVAEGKGPLFFKTQANCEEGKKGGEGEWEARTRCVKVANKVGALFFKTQAECEKGEGGGEGEWEFQLEQYVLFEPLRQPVEGGPQGSLEALKLCLLTTSNEIVRLIPGNFGQFFESGCQLTPLRDRTGANRANPQVDVMEWVNNGEVEFGLFAAPEDRVGTILCDEIEMGANVLVNNGLEETKLALPWGVAENRSPEAEIDPRSEGCRTGGLEAIHTYFDILGTGVVGSERVVASITFPERRAAKEKESWRAIVHNLRLSQRFGRSYCTVSLNGIEGTMSVVTQGFVEEAPPNLNVAFVNQRLPVRPVDTSPACPKEEELNANFFIDTASTETDTVFFG